MTQYNNLKTNKKSKDINEETEQELIDNMSELTYTLFSFVEDFPDNFDTIPPKPTYPENLPDDNVEAAICLMKNSKNKQKKE